MAGLINRREFSESEDLLSSAIEFAIESECHDLLCDVACNGSDILGEYARRASSALLDIAPPAPSPTVTGGEQSSSNEFGLS
jgi:hypothetical protein